MPQRKVIAVSLEHRFYRYNDKVYTKLSFAYPYWQDYLKYFDEVAVVARVKHVNSISSEYKQASGDKVVFFDMPYFMGPLDFLIKFPSVLRRAHLAARKYNYFLLRSGNITNVLWLFVMVYGKKYLREFPGNIKEGVIGVAGSSLVMRVLAFTLHHFARLQGKYSEANSFVSEYCASLYGSRRPSFVFSSFQLDEITEKKADYRVGERVSLVAVGRLEGEKGHEDLIRALKILSERSINAELHLIGNGRKMTALQNLAAYLGVSCHFYGAISDRQDLFRIIKDADVFVIPSHTEGMPRALLEAMAMGMPCIGTNVGGIPEVLASCALVEPHSPDGLASKIEAFSESLSVRQEQGLFNASLISSRFAREVTDRKRLEFWGAVYD